MRPMSVRSLLDSTNSRRHYNEHNIVKECSGTVEKASTGRRSLVSEGSIGNTTSPRSTNGRHRYDVTPTRSLFSNYLLREIEPHEQPPTLTVVLDLDETLVSNRRADLPQAILRPYALDVLSALRRLPGVEIVLWTASTEETGQPVVRQLTQRGPIFDQVVFRNEMWFTEPIHTKDLRLLGRDMSRVVVFDNAPNCCKLNPRNAVIVEDFHGVCHNEDTTLISVLQIVQMLLADCGKGRSVSDALHNLTTSCSVVSNVQYALPPQWQGIDLTQYPPIAVPPHGFYFKAIATTSPNS